MKTKQNIHKSQLLWLPKLCPFPFDGLWLEKRKGRFDHRNQQILFFYHLRNFMFKSSLTNWLHRFKPLFFAAR